jgi:hypothetical protein
MAILLDGFRTTIGFGAGNTASTLYLEKFVTPPGLDARDGIDITNMRNIKYLTMIPKQLVKWSNMTAEVQWDPALFDPATIVIGVNTNIWITFPNGARLMFYGWVDKIVPGQLKEGENPTATLTIIASHTVVYNCVASEALPQFYPGPC